MAYKGKYSIRNPAKYRGNPTLCIFRSSWEFKFMKWCDLNTAVIWWSSEPFAINYLSPKDGQMHRYFPDFIVHLKKKDGAAKTMLIEIKPEKQTRPPATPMRKSKKFLKEVETWGVNQAKWKAAETLCKTKGWEFVKMTEKALGL